MVDSSSRVGNTQNVPKLCNAGRHGTLQSKQQTIMMEVCQKDTTPTRELLGGQR